MRRVLTPEDLKKGDLMEPGWFPFEITDYTEEPADTDGSTNCIFHFKCIAEGPFKGVSPRKLFNEKALGFGKSLYAALNLPFDKEKGYDLSTDLFKQTIGHKVMGYVKRGKSNKGNEFNDLVDFKAMAA